MSYTPIRPRRPGEHCHKCTFFHSGTKRSSALFICRKRAPRIIIEESTTEGIWPTVDPKDWCGDYLESYPGYIGKLDAEE
jgi:hypothetical protein